MFGKPKPEGSEHTFLASEIVAEPGKMLSMKGKYIIIRDVSVTGSYDALVKAMNLVAAAGWRCVNVMAVGATMFAMMEHS